MVVLYIKSLPKYVSIIFSNRVLSSYVPDSTSPLILRGDTSIEILRIDLAIGTVTNISIVAVIIKNNPLLIVFLSPLD